MKHLIFLIVFASAIAAHAVGEFSCTASDNNVDIKIAATQAMVLGSPLTQPTTITLNIKAPLKAPLMSGKMEMDLGSVYQYWNRHGAMNMEIVNENDDGDIYSAVNLVIETQVVKGNTEESVGTYQLELTANTTEVPSVNKAFSGKISCLQIH